MLFAFAIVLLIAWLFGIIGTDAKDPFVHVPLIVAIVMFAVHMFDRNRTAG